MPIYTYRCENCGVQFEKRQKFSDDPLKQCPECGEVALRKVYLPVGIVFKGSGFYATDNRSPSGGRSSKSSTEESTSTSDNGKKETPKKTESSTDKKD